jgi:glucosamine-6-phosphate deaminase
MWTLSALQAHSKATVVADENATLELKVKTVKVSLRSKSEAP